VPVLRVDHVPIKGALLGVWQAAFRPLFDFQEMNGRLFGVFNERMCEMKIIKFFVKLNRGGRAAEYVQRVDPTPIHMTTKPKLALLMGRLTAEAATNHSESPGAARSWSRYR